MPKIYALLVGINDYALPVTPLFGCVPDVDAMYDFLDKRTAAEIKPLRNEEAHRDAVIDAFHTHLSKAGADDIALFYYSGHGVQEPTNELFYPMEPARMNEALVCYNRPEDMVEGRTFIIADKELAVLLSEVSQNGCKHIVCIFDSCHSGSGTRDGDMKGVRWLTPLKHGRKIEHYYGADKLQQRVDGNAKVPNRALSGWLAFAQSRHILLAACRSDQLAREKDFPGMETPRGTFTYHLLQLLQGTDVGALSYRELFQRLNARTLITVNEQSPQLETPAGADDLQDIEFLGRGVRPRPDHYIVRCQNGIGRVDVGAVHGIQPPSPHDPNEKTVLALFDENTSTEALRAPGARDKALGTATITRVFAAESEVLSILTGNLSPQDGSTYKAIIIAQPLPRLTVQLDEGQDGANAGAMELVRTALKTIELGGKASVAVRELSNAERQKATEPTLMVYVETNKAGQQRYRIRRVADKNPVSVVNEAGVTAGPARKVVENLEHIARYMTTLELSNPSPLLEGRVTKEVTIDGAPQMVEVDKFELIVTRVDVDETNKETSTILDLKEGIYAIAQKRPPRGQSMVPPYQYHTYAIKNNHPTATVFCVLVALDEKYEVFSCILMSPKHIRLGPGESATILRNDGNPRRIFFDLDDKLHEAGVDTIHNTLKLIISTAEISANALEQDGLNVAYGTRSGAGLPRMEKNTLGRLFRRVGTRGNFDPDEDLELADWTTRDFPVTIFRPLKQVPIPTEGMAQKVSDTVEVLPHADLAGVKIELTAEETATRDLGSYAVPAMFKLRASEPFTFGAGTQNATAGTNVLRLTGDALMAETGEDKKKQYEKVTPDNPLELTAAVPLAEDERLVAYGWDGNYFIPVGYGVPVDNKTAIRLNALTPPTSDGQRSISGSIKIFFQKVANKIFKSDFELQKLAMLTLDEKGRAAKNGKDEIVRESDRDALQEAVKNANRILLLIHGWIGDTDSMTLCLEKLHKEVVPAYDLVLTFDYENLNTLPADTAQALFNKLKDIGVGAEKQIDIVAHSMGCFVSRWLIEKVPGGAAMVSRLVMLGAPNDGTRLARIRDLANLTLFLGMNRLATHSILTTLSLPPEITTVVPSVVIERISAFLMDKIQKITDQLDMTRTLIELQPGSKKLNELRDEPLAEVDGHNIPYRIIAGDTDLVTERKVDWMERLKQFAFHESTNLVFLDEPNDATITVASQRKVPAGRTININRVATKSDHISYFYTEDTLNKLVTALTD